jgi:hypothetical protein
MYTVYCILIVESGIPEVWVVSVAQRHENHLRELSCETRRIYYNNWGLYYHWIALAPCTSYCTITVAPNTLYPLPLAALDFLLGYSIRNSF